MRLELKINLLFNMNKYIIVCFALLILCCKKEPTELDLLNKKNPEGIYGEKFSHQSSYSISEILNSSNNYLNKDVIVSGKIAEVCPMRGCWIELIDNDNALSLRAKVTDGEIVFPLSAKERSVIVKGVFTKLDLSKEQALNWKIHLAEEQGISLDPDSVVLNPEDYYEYRVNCTGAIIL